MMNRKQQEGKQKLKKFMNRNVTEFRHLIKNNQMNQNDLTWVINLRESKAPPKMQVTVPNPPEVYFKKTQNSNQRSASQNLQSKSFKANEYDMFILKNPGSPKNTHNQINFYSTLRRQSNKSTARINHTQTFDNIPFVDRQKAPQFIKKEFIKKVKGLTTGETQSAIDGSHKYEPYTQNILNTKNYGFLQTFAKVHGRSQVSLPSLAWQIGLRNYR